MSRYIDAERIKYTEYINGDVTVSKDLVEKIPTADVQEVRHGKWELIEKNVSKCSVCGCTRNIKTQFGWNFCPVCGAKIDGGGEK